MCVYLTKLRPTLCGYSMPVVRWKISPSHSCGPTSMTSTQIVLALPGNRSAHTWGPRSIMLTGNREAIGRQEPSSHPRGHYDVAKEPGRGRNQLCRAAKCGGASLQLFFPA